jgi:hypothetical protein
VYFVRGMDTSNITLDTEQFETIEEALKRACVIEKTGALVELFQDDNPPCPFPTGRLNVPTAPTTSRRIKNGTSQIQHQCVISPSATPLFSRNT